MTDRQRTIGPTPELTPAERDVLRRRYYDMMERQFNKPEPPEEPKTPYDDGNGPTPQRLARAGDTVEVSKPGENENWRAIRLLDDHVLEDLKSRGSISLDQYGAGMRFYADWYLSGLANSGVIDPGRVVVDGGKMDHLNDIKLSALNRWQKAVQALGMIASQVLTDILLTEEGLASYGRRRCGQNNPKLARVAATAVLKHSLDALDYYYYGQRHTKVRASHAEDYRPTIVTEDEASA